MTPREGVPVAYRVERDVPNMDERYERLIGPDGKRVTTLTEPEDRNFYRDLAPVLDLLNAQHAAIAAHPAATAREEAWKAMVEALTYIASHRGLTLLGDGSYSDGVRDGWIELADAADRALALARSVKGTEA